MEQNTNLVLSKSDFIEKDGSYMMSLTKLAKMLGYKNPKKIYDLYRQYKDELEVYSVVPESGTNLVGKPKIHLTENGCYLVAMFARTEKALLFRRALAKLLTELRKGKVGIIDAEMLKAYKQDLAFWKYNALKLYEESVIRRAHTLSPVKAKIINNLNETGMDYRQICKVCEVKVQDFVDLIMAKGNKDEAYEEYKKLVDEPVDLEKGLWRLNGYDPEFVDKSIHGVVLCQ